METAELDIFIKATFMVVVVVVDAKHLAVQQLH
jgi:hypothetical protein